MKWQDVSAHGEAIINEIIKEFALKGQNLSTREIKDINYYGNFKTIQIVRSRCLLG